MPPLAAVAAAVLPPALRRDGCQPGAVLYDVLGRLSSRLAAGAALLLLSSPTAPSERRPWARRRSAPALAIADALAGRWGRGWPLGSWGWARACVHCEHRRLCYLGRRLLNMGRQPSAMELRARHN